MPGGSIRGEGERRVRVCACAGYALLSFACQLAVWGGLRLSERTGFDVPSILTWWTVPLLVAMATALLAMGAAASLRASEDGGGPWRHAASRTLPFASAACAITGYGLVAMAPSDPRTIVAAGAVLVGAGMGALSASWAQTISNLGFRDVPRLVLKSVVACAALSLVTEPLPLPVLELAYVVAACGSATLLAVVRAAFDRAPVSADAPPSAARTAGRELRQAPREPQEGLREMLGAVRNPLFCAASIAFAVALTRTMTLRAQPAMVGASGVACMAVGAGVLLVVLRRSEDGAPGLTIPALFRILFPVVATLLLALSAGGERLAAVAGAAVFAAYALMQALMVPACIDAARRKGVRATAVYGLFAGAVYAVFAASTQLGVILFSGGDGVGATASLTAALLVLYVLAMAYAFVQRRAGSDGGGAGGGSVAAAGAEDGAAVGGAGTDDGVSGSFAATGAKVLRGASEARASGDFAAAASAGGAAGTAMSGVGRGEPDPISRRCLVLAQRFALSPRETDVLVAFAHGRNVSYLAERLCLSPNTIRSHSKTLYAKLGVHSKQELLNLVDEVA